MHLPFTFLFVIVLYGLILLLSPSVSMGEFFSDVELGV